MKKKWATLVLLLFFFNTSEAQLNRYIIRFKNKANNSFTINNPSAYLSTRALDRRARFGINIDSADLPVSPAYITPIRNLNNVTVLAVSKWLNAIAIYTSDAATLTTIHALPFVESITAVAGREVISGRASYNKFTVEEETVPINSIAKTKATQADYYNYGTGSYNEIHLHNGEFLHNIGLQGQGMQIALLDNGYANYLNLKAFDSANANSQILGSWDFVFNEANVVNDGSHGMNCFSIIAANIPGQFVGKAPKANFWLYKTEDDNSEYPIEEFFWACGAERADSSGADVISSSLGYGYGFDGGLPNYNYSTLNGNTTMSAIAADMAAKKGMMVFVSAGNAGNIAWRQITTPSDADSVVCVAAVNSNGAVGSFSSYGPSGDAEIKPDLASVGVATLIQSNSNTVVTGNGTSFACPNMAGLATCLWQGFPEYNNMKIIQALKQSAHKFSSPDDRVGYGIPNVKNAFSRLLNDYSTLTAYVTTCTTTLTWNSKDIAGMKYEIERKLATEAVYTKVGQVNAMERNAFSNHSYTYHQSILGLPAGTINYRIRQIIDTTTLNFHATYIDSVQINTPTDCIVGNDIIIQLRPNPVSNDEATLYIETPDAINNLSVLLFDIKGSLLWQAKESKLPGRKVISIPVEKFQKGIYYFKVYNNDQLIGYTEMVRG
jgi:subtilisin family serine protease